jgi:phage repressor protein C with HTH and peptisase S24 domain
MPYGKSEQPTKVGNTVPGWTPELGTRLAKLVAEVGGNVAAGQIAAVSDEMISRYVNGRAKPSLFAMRALATEANMSLDWLATGEQKAMTTLDEDGLPLFKMRGEDDTGYTLVPRYEVRAGAGAGIVVHSEQIVDHLAFRAKWVREKLRINPEHLIVLEAAGDSMANTIADGDLMLVSIAEPRVSDNAVYVLSLGGEIIVKRIERKMDGGLLVKSDNPRYSTQEVEACDVADLRVVGRVIRSLGLVR